ncbi:TPA: hypothetical protein OUF26_004673 [Enterobacter kobei]|uniref:hypothetical protein n=1 Tax=Enterobacteriaceae TaxID=543 RepID=UPI0022A3A1F9|nr:MULTISPECIES: hypothetical protein [Enterobacteriaceae]ELW9374670.1 hypothetical protein [Enterobacter hormaechei]MDA4772825.1 hypothetical protein [Enterobacter hormaechei]HCU0609950.1 hypothetical protein [Enterobacter kobei]
MKSKKFVAVLFLFIAGCSQNSNPQKNTSVRPILTKEISPTNNVESTASLGSYVVYNQLVSTLKTDMVTLGNASGAMSEIKAGNYCHVGDGVYTNFDDSGAVGLKSLAGQVVSHTSSVRYDRTKNTISPPNSTTFDSSEISIKFTPDTDCHVVKEVVQAISFNGKSGGDLNFIYSENYPGLKESKTDFSVPLSDAKEKVQYKNLAFKVVGVDGSGIRYIVLP